MSGADEQSASEQLLVPDKLTSSPLGQYKFVRRVGWAIVSTVIVVTVVIPIVALTWFLWDMGVLTPHPSDQELINLLENNRSKFEKLLSMFQHDDLIRVHPAQFDPDDGISEARWEEYRAIFNELGIDVGMQGWPGQGVWFIVEAKGIVGTGSTKGLMYRPAKPEPIYENLDKGVAGLDEGVIAYRKIDDDWYITFEYSN